MRRSRPGSAIVTILLICATYTYWSYAKYLIAAVILALIIRIAVKLTQKLRIVTCNLRLRDVDTMNGLEFERYIADLLKQRGFHNISLTEQYDMGVDIVAEKEGVRWGIQVKRHSGLVKAAAVRQAVTALRFYGCDRAMVVTNSTYSNVARQLAESNDCVLIDRTRLFELL